MNGVTANVTTGIASVGTLQSLAGFGWLLTIIIGFVILGVLFVLFKNFRRFMYGLPIVGGLLIIFWIAKSIGFSTAEGNLGSLKVLLWIVGIIGISTIVGKLMEKTSYVKKFEEAVIDDEKTTGKKDNKKSN
jgi:hypothetical protein